MPFFELKTKLYFGRGEIKKLAKHLSTHNFTKCGIVVDRAIAQSELFKGVLSLLEKEMQAVKVLQYEHGGEPTYDYLDSVKDFFKKDEVVCLLGIGGGSAMDTAKGLAILINNPVKKAIELRGFPQLQNLPLPVITVPTISGTGAEVTYYAAFIDTGERRKLGINTTHNFPVFSVLDPALTRDAPLKPSLSSALDCLVQTVDTFMSKNATFMSRPLSIEAFAHVMPGIRGLIEDPQDIDAREELMRASYIHAIALMNSGICAAHALAHPLGTLFNVPHGISGAFFLQHFLPYDLKRGYTDLYRLYDRVYGPSLTPPEEKADKIVADIVAIIEKAKVPERLSAFGVKKKDISDFVYHTVNYHAAGLVGNPVEISPEELDRFLLKIL